MLSQASHVCLQHGCWVGGECSSVLCSCSVTPSAAYFPPPEKQMLNFSPIRSWIFVLEKKESLQL